MNNDAFRRAQLAYDHRLPPEEQPKFLETKEGQAWLASGADMLVYGFPVQWRSFSTRGQVDALDLSIVHEKVMALDENDSGFRLAELVRCVATSDFTKAVTVLNELFSKEGCTAFDSLREIAMGQLEQHAEQYAKAERENNDDEALLDSAGY